MQETLEELLARLKAEITDAEAGHPDRDELARLARAVERRLDPGEPDDEGFEDELRDSSERWQASHPDLAAAIGRAADVLGGMGL